jgi:beta-glucosidase-like glycosyl hydrolase
LDEDVRNVRDLLERLKTNHYYRSEKATSFSETTLLGRESGELFDEKQRRDDSEEDFYEEEVKEESKEEDRTRRRQLLLLQNHLLLPTNAEIAGVTATTQTPRTKKTEDWSVPAEDLVLLSSFRDDDENNENFVSSNPTAESLRAAGVIF